MSKTIADFNAANSIDGSNDYLLIEPSGNTVYKKINRNTLLGLSSAPIGTTDSQSPTNKTFDNTNAYTIKDGSLTLQNTGSLTRQATFSLSGITAGQTRIMTLPDANATLVGTATTQTLTNKTITSPTITGGTIDNSTITVDSIAGHTSGTIVTVANLQISNGVLNTANSVTSTAVADGAILPKALVTGTGSGWAWQSFTPTFTNLTVGSGTLTAKYIQIGKTVFFRVALVFAANTSVSGSVSFTLPVTSVSYAGTASLPPLGDASYFQSFSFVGRTMWNSTTTAVLVAEAANGVWLEDSALSSTAPFTWTTSNELHSSGRYEAA